MSRVSERAKSFALAGVFACECAFLMTTFIYLLLVRLIDPFSSWLFVMSNVGNPAIIGVLIGALIGSVWSDARGGVWLALVGAFGFVLGAVGRSAVSALLVTSLAPASTSPSILGGLSPSFLYALSLGVEGIIGGSILGLAIGKRSLNESIVEL